MYFNKSSGNVLPVIFPRLRLNARVFFRVSITACRSCALDYAVARPEAKFMVDAFVFVLPGTGRASD